MTTKLCTNCNNIVWCFQDGNIMPKQKTDE